jgi:ribosomal protein S18 acetylase RimI-like enzyme
LIHHPSLYFIVAYDSKEYAGFVFGHTVGKQLWRKFARAHLWSHGLDIARLLIRHRLIRTIGQAVNSWKGDSSPSEEPEPRSERGSSEAALGKLSRAEGFSELGRPFAWSNALDTGYISSLYVSEHKRGRGIAPALLDFVCAEMCRDGARAIEAHADAGNISSARAFQKSDFSVFRAAGGDFYMCRSLR